MSDETQLLYLEPDDEITSVVRRLREADAARVVLVASGRTKATSSAVALRLLARVAADEGREVALVADPVARALAGEAGIDAFASVAEASADGAVPLEPPAPRRAPIRVVRGEGPPPAIAASALATPGTDETQAVPVAPPAVIEQPAARRARSRRFVAGLAIALLLVTAAAAAAVMPSATVRVTAATRDIEPWTDELELPIADVDVADIRVTREGTAGGVEIERIAAAGTVTFFNWGGASPSVPAGSRVSVDGEIQFATQAAITVPPAQFLPDGRTLAGEASVAVSAVEAGPTSNVAAMAIDTVENATLRLILRGLPNNPQRLVQNIQATTGGAEIEHPVIRQEDVDAVATAIRQEIATQVAAELADDPERLYPPVEIGEPTIPVPEALVGTQDQATFELVGSLLIERPFVLVADIEREARQRVLADADAAPPGTMLVRESLRVVHGGAVMVGDALRVSVTVRGEAVAQLDGEAIRSDVLGLTPDEARTALLDRGDAEVDLWPGWIDRIPRLDWRVSVEIVDQPS